MVLFCTFGAIQSFGVYQDYYTVRVASDHALLDCAQCMSTKLTSDYSTSESTSRARARRPK